MVSASQSNHGGPVLLASNVQSQIDSSKSTLFGARPLKSSVGGSSQMPHVVVAPSIVVAPPIRVVPPQVRPNPVVTAAPRITFAPQVTGAPPVTATTVPAAERSEVPERIPKDKAEPLTPALQVMNDSEKQSHQPSQCSEHPVPNIMHIDQLDPADVYIKLKEGSCVLVDVRGEDCALASIDGSLHIPACGKDNFFSRINTLVEEWAGKAVVVFMCEYSVHRAPHCANWYRAKADADQQVAILTGGFRGWVACGLPVHAMNPEKQQDEPKAIPAVGTNVVLAPPARVRAVMQMGTIPQMGMRLSGPRKRPQRFFQRLVQKT